MSRSLDLAFLLIQLSFPLQKNNTDQINEVYEFFFVQGRLGSKLNLRLEATTSKQFL